MSTTRGKVTAGGARKQETKEWKSPTGSPNKNPLHPSHCTPEEYSAYFQGKGADIEDKRAKELVDSGFFTQAQIDEHKKELDKHFQPKVKR